MARVAAVAGMISAGLSVLATLLQRSFGGMLGVAVAVALSASLWFAADALKKVRETDDADQRHLISAVSTLRNYFAIKTAVYVLGTLLACCVSGVVVLAIVVGATAFLAATN